MTNTVVALYDDFASANAAVRDLVDHGFSRDDISLIASDQTGEYGRYLTNAERRDDMGTSGAAEGASVGAGVGAVIGGLGGLLVGLGALAIPGIGPVIAAGPLAAALSALAGAGAGAVAGGVTGGLLGALTDLGIPKEPAEYYAEGVRRGGHLVTLTTTDDMTNRAVELLNHHNPVDVNERVEQWRHTGWTGFDPNAQPYHAVSTEQDDWPRATEESAMDTGMDMGNRDVRDSRIGRAMDSEWPGPAGSTVSYNDFSYYDTDFRHHFENSSYAQGYTYDQFRPAYRYGYDLATDENFRGRSWSDLEMDAQHRWEESNPGTWDRFKESVRHAWEEIKDTVS